MQLDEKIRGVVRDVMDYPKPGILFKDITPVLAAPALIDEIVESLAARYQSQKLDAVVAVEARGFIFGSILAHALKTRLVLVRKAGKLPYKTRRQSYALEYGNAEIEIHDDALQPGWRVLVHDDVLATGGTAIAAAELCKSFGCEIVEFNFLIGLSFLPGKEKIHSRFGINPYCVVDY